MESGRRTSGTDQGRMEEQMKRYSITVNGKIFDVEVEEVTDTAGVSGTDGAGKKEAKTQAGTLDQKKKSTPEKKASPEDAKGEPSSEQNSEGGASIHRSRTPKTPKKKEQAVNNAQSADLGDDSLRSPMPGTVLKVCVNPGDEVYAGETLIILEAMKMENEINSHKTGKIGTISVKAGDAVNTGDLLLTVE